MARSWKQTASTQHPPANFPTASRESDEASWWCFFPLEFRWLWSSWLWCLGDSWTYIPVVGTEKPSLSVLASESPESWNYYKSPSIRQWWLLGTSAMHLKRYKSWPDLFSWIDLQSSHPVHFLPRWYHSRVFRSTPRKTCHLAFGQISWRRATGKTRHLAQAAGEFREQRSSLHILGRQRMFR